MRGPKPFVVLAFENTRLSMSAEEPLLATGCSVRVMPPLPHRGRLWESALRLPRKRRARHARRSMRGEYSLRHAARSKTPSRQAQPLNFPFRSAREGHAASLRRPTDLGSLNDVRPGVNDTRPHVTQGESGKRTLLAPLSNGPTRPSSHRRCGLDAYVPWIDVDCIGQVRTAGQNEHGQ